VKKDMKPTHPVGFPCCHRLIPHQTGHCLQTNPAPDIKKQCPVIYIMTVIYIKHFIEEYCLKT